MNRHLAKIVGAEATFKISLKNELTNLIQKYTKELGIKDSIKVNVDFYLLDLNSEEVERCWVIEIFREKDLIINDQEWNQVIQTFFHYFLKQELYPVKDNEKQLEKTLRFLLKVYKDLTLVNSGIISLLYAKSSFENLFLINGFKNDTREENPLFEIYKQLDSNPEEIKQAINKTWQKANLYVEMVEFTDNIIDAVVRIANYYNPN